MCIRVFKIFQKIALLHLKKNSLKNHNVLNYAFVEYKAFKIKMPLKPSATSFHGIIEIYILEETWEVSLATQNIL